MFSQSVWRISFAVSWWNSFDRKPWRKRKPSQICWESILNRIFLSVPMWVSVPVTRYEWCQPMMRKNVFWWLTTFLHQHRGQNHWQISVEDPIRKKCELLVSFFAEVIHILVWNSNARTKKNWYVVNICPPIWRTKWNTSLFKCAPTQKSSKNFESSTKMFDSSTEMFEILIKIFVIPL